MGWCGYGIYDGDGTQTEHYSILEKMKFKEDQIESWMSLKGTIIPKEEQEKFFLNLPKIKCKKPKFWNEDKAIFAQMLLSLFVDNKFHVPKEIKMAGLDATEYLMGDHCKEFNEPHKRRKVLKNFLLKAKKLKSI